MITIHMGRQLIAIFQPVALAVYTRSPAAYKSQQNFGTLKLPLMSTMQVYTGAFMHSPGTYSGSSG